MLRWWIGRGLLAVAAVGIGVHAPAHAAGVAGTAVSGTGGGFSGPAEVGALGVFTNPAAAATGSAPELLIDFGMFRQALSMELDAWEAPAAAVYYPAQPSASLAIPIGKLGIGAAFQVPYTRGGENDPTHPIRYFSLRSTLRLVEGDVMASYRVHPNVVLGAGLRIGQLTYQSDKATDTGVSINEAFDIEPPFPEGDPFLQGEQRVGPLTGIGLSWVAGATVRLPAGAEVHLAFRPPWRVWSRGGIEQEPSVDLNAAILGNAAVRLSFPMVATLAGRIPVGPVSLIPEIEYVGWRAAGRSTSDISDFTIASPDPLFDGLLVNAGLSEADFLSGSEGINEIDLGWRDVINPGLAAQWQPTTNTALRGGIWYAPTAMPDEVVTPSNVDFATVTLRAAGAWQPVSVARLGLTFDYLHSPERRVVTGPGTGGLPSGSGVV